MEIMRYEKILVLISLLPCLIYIRVIKAIKFKIYLLRDLIVNAFKFVRLEKKHLMIFYFLSLSTSTWWNFSINEFDELLKNSMNIPIFALCFSHHCPHCIGLPELLKNFSDGIGNRDDIIYTAVNCDESDHCTNLQAEVTPSIIFIQGIDSKYWHVINSFNFTGWNYYIGLYSQSNFKEIYSDSELEQEKMKDVHGGTLFYLETNSKDDPLISELKNISIIYKVYNDSFAYRVNKNVKTSFSAFTSRYCKKEYQFPFNKTEFISFIEKYKFGALHKYYFAEYIELLKLASNNYRNKKLIFLVVEGNLNQTQKNTMIEMTKNHCLLNTGWISCQDGMQFFRFTQTKYLDVPFLYFYDVSRRNNEKSFVYKKKMEGEKFETLISAFDQRGLSQNDFDGFTKDL